MRLPTAMAFFCNPMREPVAPFASRAQPGRRSRYCVAARLNRTLPFPVTTWINGPPEPTLKSRRRGRMFPSVAAGAAGKSD